MKEIETRTPQWDKINTELYPTLSEKGFIVGLCQEPVELYWQLARECVAGNSQEQGGDYDVVELERSAYELMSDTFRDDVRSYNPDTPRDNYEGLRTLAAYGCSARRFVTLSIDDEDSGLETFKRRLPFYDAGSPLLFDLLFKKGA